MFSFQCNISAITLSQNTIEIILAKVVSSKLFKSHQFLKETRIYPPVIKATNQAFLFYIFFVLDKKNAAIRQIALDTHGSEPKNGDDQ